MTYVEKQVLLQSLDHLWREHLVTLDHLRQVIGWRGYAQRDPLNEYKSEAFELFNGLVGHLRRAGYRPAHAHPGRVPAAGTRRIAADVRPAPRSRDGRERDGDGRLARPRPGLSAPRRHPLRAMRRAATRPTPRPGAASAATNPAPADRARSSSIATGSSSPRAPPATIEKARPSRRAFCFAACPGSRLRRLSRSMACRVNGATSGSSPCSADWPRSWWPTSSGIRP